MKFRILASIASLASMSFMSMSGATLAAQQATSLAHPLVGVWEMTVDLGAGDTGCPAQITFSPFYSSVQVDCEGVVAVGIWEPTSDTTANLAITAYNPNQGRYMIRLAIEVAEDLQTFTGSFTFELIDTETGEGRGQYGPGTATATRQEAEAPGTPVGPISDMFAQFETSAQATPAA